MKKIIFASICLVLVLYLLGCQEKGTDNSSKAPVIAYEKLNVDIDLLEAESPTCCYTDESQMIFSVGVRNGAQDGPLVNTTRLVIYDYSSGKITKEYLIDSEAYIYNAMPYGDGILFSTYGNLDEKKTLWKVQHISEKGIETIDRGYARSYDLIPNFGINKEGIIYCYEDIDEGEYTFGVKAVNGLNSDIVFSEESDYRLVNPGRFPCNNNNYMLMVGKLKDDYATMVIGDQSGITGKYPLKEKLSSYGINDNMAICSSVKTQDEYSLHTVNLKIREEDHTNSGRPLFRIEGSGDSFVSVDSKFNLFVINNSEEVTKVEFDPPGEIGKGYFSFVLFYPISNGNYIALFDNEHYYKMKVSYR